VKVKFDPNADETILHKDLTPNNVYRVISLEADYIRIMSDEGLPYCYPASLFVVVDNQWPRDWIAAFGEDGERYVAPEALSNPGFFELYFDGDKEAHLILRKRLQKWRSGED
jgi:hypothetical protein